MSGFRRMARGGGAVLPGGLHRSDPSPDTGVLKLKALERENRELRQADEILRKASAYFAQAELDRRVKP
jgi:transposase-like protein